MPLKPVKKEAGNFDGNRGLMNLILNKKKTTAKHENFLRKIGISQFFLGGAKTLLSCGCQTI